jgi:hypothetical protein
MKNKFYFECDKLFDLHQTFVLLRFTFFGDLFFVVNFQFQ